jgi:hypothetical protein
LPWIAEHGVKARGQNTSTIDLLPPPGITRLDAGDFVEATVEHIVMPQFVADYYGPNKALKAALATEENTWQMIHREAVGNDRRVTAKLGVLKRLYPDVHIQTVHGEAELSLAGGLGYVPITFTNLDSHRDYVLTIDDQPIDQAIHGNDFWQTDYDASSESWSRTYTIPVRRNAVSVIRFEPLSRKAISR